MLFWVPERRGECKLRSFSYVSFQEKTVQPAFQVLESDQVAPDACLGLFGAIRLTSELVRAEESETEN